MIRIVLVGGIGSGKTFISKLFGFPVFNADQTVAKIYLKNKNIYFKLIKKIPNFFTSFPIKKEELVNAILKNKNNIKKISSIVHPEVRKDLQKFIRKNKERRAVLLDIPLYLENKLNKKKDIIIFIESSKNEAIRRIKKRRNYNKLVLQKLEKLQLPLDVKKRKSHYVIKNSFKKNLARKNVKDILDKIM